ncbi:MAG: NADH-ubiquinone oxidoreductase-F iron-sulfur binding region domain-containing protein [Candidatus Competibacterales bacterium]
MAKPLNYRPATASHRPLRPVPKGRQVDAKARATVSEQLEGAPRGREWLIEHLHTLQDAFGCLTTPHLAALAAEMNLAFAEVFEVATFYAHFFVVEADATPPVLPIVRVCDGLSCELAGACGLHGDLVAHLGDRATVVKAPCMGRCDVAPVVEVGHRHLDNATVETVTFAVEAGETAPVIPPYQDFDAYVASGGYELLKACRRGSYEPQAFAALLDTAGLRGLGGAGFPTHRKWSFVRQGVAKAGPGPCYVAINADEGEPGTFKDRHHLEREPHRVLEGTLISAWGVGAETVYIYLRDEYPAVHHIFSREIPRLTQAGLAPPGGIHLRRGAGAYICGEETAMLESLEGKRGLPRHKPPYAAEVGLFGRPTLIHNVETVYWIREIIDKGPEAFAARGKPGHRGVRSYSVSGRVKQPGVKVAPAGTTALELIEHYAGGMLEGHTFKAYLPGGASGGILPAAMADLPLDFGHLEDHGCFVGSHAVVILSDRDNMADVALNLLRFFQDESCGQCTPCRAGTAKAVALMERRPWDGTLLEELCQVMADASICGLGQAAPNPIRSVLSHFAADLATATPAES